MSHDQQDALWRRDAVELADLIRTCQVSSREVIDAHLERIEAVNPKLNAIVLTLASEARAAAEAADQALARGEALGPLHGVPVTTKVNTDQAGCPTDNGVVALKNNLAWGCRWWQGATGRACASTRRRLLSPSRNFHCQWVEQTEYEADAEEQHVDIGWKSSGDSRRSHGDWPSCRSYFYRRGG